MVKSMAAINVGRSVICPKCGRETFTKSPLCRCWTCRAEWTIEWRMSPEEFWSFNSSAKAKKTIATLAAQSGLDARALHTLFNTQWNLDGKEGDWINYSEVPPADLADAQAAGVMQDSVELDHETLNARTIATRDALDRREVATAFVQSLTTRRLDQRSILGSFASALHLMPHAFTAEKADEACRVCGACQKERIDFNHATFRRLMWAGNVLQGMPNYVLCDLVAFDAAPRDPQKPDKKLLNSLFNAIRELPPQAGLSDLEKSIAGLFPANKRERTVVLEILGLCGILKPKDFPSKHVQWIDHADYPIPTHFFRREWRTPVNCWTGADGVDEAAVAFWFGL